MITSNRFIQTFSFEWNSINQYSGNSVIGGGEGFEPSFIHRFDMCIPIQIKRRIKWLFYILNVHFEILLSHRKLCFQSI